MLSCLLVATVTCCCAWHGLVRNRLHRIWVSTLVPWRQTPPPSQSPASNNMTNSHTLSRTWGQREDTHTHMCMWTCAQTHTHTLRLNMNMSHLNEDENTDYYKTKHWNTHILSTISANMINRHTVMEMLVHTYKMYCHTHTNKCFTGTVGRCSLTAQTSSCTKPNN